MCECVCVRERERERERENKEEGDATYNCSDPLPHTFSTTKDVVKFFI